MENQNELQGLRRELRITRIFCMVSSLLTAGLLMAIIIISVKVQPLFQNVGEAQTVLDNLAELDVDAMNGALEQLENLNLDALADSMGELDMEVLNDTMEQVNSALEALDMDALSTAIDNLNGAAEILQSVNNRLGSLFGRNG